MPRPNNRKALDGKSYKVIEYHPRTGIIFPENPEEWKGDIGMYWESARMYRLEECSEDNGHIIVWEKSDELGCPICTEGKSCFQRSNILYASEVKKVLKDDKTKYFRLLVKGCLKKPGNYIFQHLCNLEEYESAGNTVLSKFIRIIEARQFKNRCIFCPSGNLVLKKSERDHITQVICRGCRSFFYVADCPVVLGSNFEGKCPRCKRKYSDYSELGVDLDAAKGAYYIQCRLCGETYVFLGSKFEQNSRILEYALGIAEFKKFSPELGKGL